jgi:hypothetical protein
MPVSLASANANSLTDLDVSVIDEFRKSALLDAMTFDDVVNPAGGGATLTYGYRRKVSAGAAAFRAINSEYTPAEVTTTQINVTLKPLGGSFQVDRVLAKVGPATSGAIALQMADKIEATKRKFGDAVINGDVALDANGFDGLSKALAGSTTEDTVLTDLTGTQTMDWAFRVLSMVDDLLSLMDGDASFIFANKRLLNIIRGASRMTNQYTKEVGPRGQALEMYGTAVLQDLGTKDGSVTDYTVSDVIPINVADPDGAGPLVAGSTAIYAVRLGLDAFHGVSVAGGQLVQTWMPDFSVAGAVKTGEVELGPVAVALKRTKAAAVKRNIKVQ